MHIVRNREPIPYNRDTTLEPGEWLMEDLNAFEAGVISNRGTVTIESRGSRMRWFMPMAATNGSVLVLRSGAIGDLLLASPALAAYKNLHVKPGALHLSCLTKHHQLFDNTGLFDAILPYPFDFNKANDYTLIISLENVIETNNEIHATDAFASELGDTLVTDYKPVFTLTPEEKEAGKAHFKGGRPVVGIQPRASARNRDYPAHLLSEAILLLQSQGWEIVLFGLDGQFPPFPPAFRHLPITDLSRRNLTLRQSAAVLANCQAFVGVDSAFIHLCHALDVPAIGLYGAFPWQIRTSKAPLTYSITGPGDCAGCCWLASNVKGHFPPNKPCSEKQFCVVLAGIDPRRIVAKVNELRPK